MSLIESIPTPYYTTPYAVLCRVKPHIQGLAGYPRPSSSILGSCQMALETVFQKAKANAATRNQHPHDKIEQPRRDSWPMRRRKTCDLPVGMWRPW